MFPIARNTHYNFNHNSAWKVVRLSWAIIMHIDLLKSIIKNNLKFICLKVNFKQYLTFKTVLKSTMKIGFTIKFCLKPDLILYVLFSCRLSPKTAVYLLQSWVAQSQTWLARAGILDFWLEIQNSSDISVVYLNTFSIPMLQLLVNLETKNTVSQTQILKQVRKARKE